MNARRHVLAVFILFLFGLFGAGRSFAQVDQGSVAGIIRDPQNSVIAGAKVTLINKETNLTLTRSTDRSSGRN